MNIWNARIWVGIIVGKHPTELYASEDDEAKTRVVKYTYGRGQEGGRLYIAGPINPMAESEPDSGHYEIKFQRPDGKIDVPVDRISAADEIHF